MIERVKFEIGLIIQVAVVGEETASAVGSAHLNVGMWYLIFHLHLNLGL